MRVISERQLGVVLGALPGTPRVVVGGNFTAPWRALAVLDGSLARYRLFALNAQAGMPDRPGVTSSRRSSARACAAGASCTAFPAGCRQLRLGL